MSDRALDRATSRMAAAALRPRPVALATVLAGPGAAGLGLLICAVPVLIGWATAAGSGADAVGAVRAAGQVWLAAHHVAFTLPGGPFGLLPLGLTVVPAAALVAAGRWVAQVARVGGLRSGVRAAAGLAAAYAVTAAVVSGLTGTSNARPQHWQALAGGAVLGAAFGGLAVLHAAGLVGPLREWVKASVPRLELAQAGLKAAAGAVAAMLAAGAALVAGSLAAHGADVAALHRAVGPGVVGGVLLTLIGLAYLPNAAVWAAAYTAGPGFAVGAGTSVAPRGVDLGDLPSFPVLAGLPSPGTHPPAASAVLLVPVVAGVVAGVIVLRSLDRDDRPTRVRVAAAAGGVSGLALGGLAALSGGPLGDGRLTAVGPSPWQVALAAGAEVAAAAALTAFLLGRAAGAGSA